MKLIKMKVVQLVLVLCSLQLILSAPSPPQLSETFTAWLKVTISDKHGDHTGLGVWGIDQPNSMGVENYKFDEGEYDIFNLQRYDLGKDYQLQSPNMSKCAEFSVNGTMPVVWAWISQAIFVGTDGHGSESVDVWEARIGYAVMRIGVKTSDPTTPVYLVRESRDEKKTVFEFTSWAPTAPASTYFNVPSSCAAQPASSTKSVGCASRSDIMARAKVWVANHVPYNQGATYQGYREDCSGYVSMAWASSKPGHVCTTFDQIAHPISKAELQPGDCLLYAAEHVVLFGGWTDTKQTTYQAYEETRPGEGTVTRSTPYPYWYSQSDFLPYRYNDVC